MALELFGGGHGVSEQLETERSVIMLVFETTFMELELRLFILGIWRKEIGFGLLSWKRKDWKKSKGFFLGCFGEREDMEERVLLANALRRVKLDSISSIFLFSMEFLA